MPDVKRIAIAGGVVIFLLLLFWRAASSVSGPSTPAASGIYNATPQGATPLIVPSPSITGPQLAVDPNTARASEVPTRIYAVSLPALAGLPSDTKPGTTLELWVAWQPPITKQPRIQRLATDVTLDRIVPPVTAEGSPAALLRIPMKEIPSVLYGDRYGSLSAVITGG